MYNSVREHCYDVPLDSTIKCIYIEAAKVFGVCIELFFDEESLGDIEYLSENSRVEVRETLLPASINIIPFSNDAPEKFVLSDIIDKKSTTKYKVRCPSGDYILICRYPKQIPYLVASPYVYYKTEDDVLLFNSLIFWRIRDTELVSTEYGFIKKKYSDRGGNYTCYNHHLKPILPGQDLSRELLYRTREITDTPDHYSDVRKIQHIRLMIACAKAQLNLSIDRAAKINIEASMKKKIKEFNALSQDYDESFFLSV